MDWTRKKNAVCGRRGSSLVEVMAAFSMLMLLLLMLAAGLEVSGRMLAKSRQMRIQLASARRACFLGDAETDVQMREQELTLELVRRGDGAAFSVDAALRSYSDGAAVLYEVAPAGGEEALYEMWPAGGKETLYKAMPADGEEELWNDLWEERE